MTMFGDAARAVADQMLGTLGGGELVMAVAGPVGDGTAVELGYGGVAPVSVVLERVHGRVLAPDSTAHLSASRTDGAPTVWWELIVPADDLEREAKGAGMTVEELVGRCVGMTYAGAQLRPEKVEGVCAGGEVYVYRVVAVRE